MVALEEGDFLCEDLRVLNKCRREVQILILVVDGDAARTCAQNFQDDHFLPRRHLRILEAI